MRRARRTPKRNSDYNVGDIVEIQRHGVVLQGRLAQLLTEGPSPNPRWLLKFDGQPYKDEEMYERSFGKTLFSVSVVDEEGSVGVVTSSASVSSASTQRKVVTVGRRAAQGNKKGGTSSEEDENEQKRLDAEDKKGEHTLDGSNAGSDVESDSSDRRAHNRRRASAREERSRRRQAKIDEEIFPNLPVHEQLLTGGKRRLSSLSTSFHNSKRSRRDGDDDYPDGNRNDNDQGKNNAVIQVNLLTGTLYLYRGKQRRAEFIRRV